MYGRNVYRYLGSEMVKCDLSGTPAFGSNVRAVIEDAARNVWFHTGTRVFMKRLDRFTISLKDPPRPAGGAVILSATTALAGLALDDLRLFWRLKDGPWRGGEAGGAAAVALPAEGEHEVEVRGMDTVGGLSEAVRFRIAAKGP